MILRRFHALTVPFISRFGKSEKYLERDILQPTEKELVVPPWISHSSYERISKVQPWSIIEKELEIVRTDQVIHAPVIRFSYGSGIIGPQGFFSKKLRRRLSKRFTRNILTKEIISAETVTYINSKSIMLYFGHWLTDGLTQSRLVESGTYYLTNQKSWRHSDEYRTKLGLAENSEKYFAVENIIVYSDFSQGSLKRKRYIEIKNQLAKSFPEPVNSEKVFLWRGSTGDARQFYDADRLKRLLQADGWKIVEVTSPLAEIFSALAKARVVAGMEGSHLNHAHFCTRAGTAMIVLVPHDAFTAVQVGLARGVGNFCGLHVLPGDRTTGYQLDFDEFTRAVDQTFATADKIF